MVVRSLGQPRHRLVEPEVLFGQGVDDSGCEPGALELLKTSRVLEPETSGGQVIEALEGLRTPRPTTLAGLPLVQKVGTAVA